MAQPRERSALPSIVGLPAPQGCRAEDPEEPSQDIDDLLEGKGRPPQHPPEESKLPEFGGPFYLHPGRQTVRGRKDFAQELTKMLIYPLSWAAIFGFIALELGSWASTGETFFGHVTGGVVESLVLAKSQALALGLSMQAHILGGSALWILGFVQVVCKFLRQSARLAIVHRISGRVFLLLFLFVVGPTAAHLSLFVGVGRANMQLLMTAFAVTGMDTTLLAYYYFWRALQLARTRSSREALELHGRAMRLGLALTLLILLQRPVQLWFIGVRKLLLLALDSHGLGGPDSVAEGVFDSILGHHASLSLTTVVLGAGLLPLLLDGPHCRLFCALLSVQTEEDRVKFFGAAVPSSRELFLWRVRVPVYLGLRALVTAGWTSEPTEVWPGPALGLNTDMWVKPP